jgi:P4 family phage/plasmid primase-like protien
MEHNPADKITKVTAFDPSDKGKELWIEALNNFFSGDTELIDYVQQMSALSTLGKVFIEAMMIAYGDGGNGKSTFGNAVLRTIGSYGGTISADALTVGCKRNVKPELAETKGKRLLIAAELEEGMRLNTSMVKQLCSTDEIAAEKKYKDPFHFTPSHTVLLYTNHLPRVGAMDEGIWRRLIVIPFNAKISVKKDVKNYADYLVENAGEYILKWLIEGAEKIIKNDFKLKLPKAVEDAINIYKRDNDWLAHFFEDCCELGDDLEEKSGGFYDAYRAFCNRTGEYVRNSAEFYAAIEQRGIKRKKTKEGRFVVGIKLINADFVK